jgi:two-component system, LytTR family, sensor kinase
MPIQIDIKRFKFYLWVGLVWLLLWLLHVLITYPQEFWPRAVNETWRAIYIVVLNFLFLEYTIPYLRLTFKRVLIGLFLIWAHLMLYSFGLYAWRYVGIHLNIYTAFRTFTSVTRGVEFQVSYSFGSVFFFGILRHVYGYVKLKQQAQQLLIGKQQAELNYLKSQTNPHFLFNTLNNIYSLARDKSDLAPESILRLSKILRFMLYETGGDYIAIEQEVKIITDYIALEKLRYDDSLQINFNYDIEDMKQALPPLLLISLVENAFKHGVSETRGRPFVDIHLSVNKRQLSFLIKNSTEPFSGEATVKENIGLSNLRRQLELLFKDYNLSVQQAEAFFLTSLKINLASHV